jgi:hypothetical protein
MHGTVKIVKVRAIEATFERVFFLMDLDPFVGSRFVKLLC